MIRNYLLMFVMLFAFSVVSGCQGARQQQVLSPVYSGDIVSSSESLSTGGSVNFGGNASASPSSGGSCQSCQ